MPSPHRRRPVRHTRRQIEKPRGAIVCIRPSKHVQGVPQERLRRPKPRIIDAYHEAGHAAAALAQGIDVHYVALFDPGVRYGGVWHKGACLPAIPPRPASELDVVFWCRAAAAIQCAGPMVETQIRAELGHELPGGADGGDPFSAADLTGFRFYRDVSPEPSEAFGVAVRDLVLEILRQHRPQIDAIAAALDARGMLNVIELHTLWHGGQLRDRGHIGLPILVASRDALATWSCTWPENTLNPAMALLEAA